MSYIPQLVQIYAAHTVAAIKNTRELLEQPFSKSLQELSTLPGFSVDQDFVRELKLSIEADEPQYNTADKACQVSECLKALMRIAVYRESQPTTVLLMIDTLRDLLTKMYAHKWKASQRQHFDFVADRLRAWHAYFLSYTNSGARVINDDYDKIIRKHADPVIRKLRDRDADNMLADAIVNWFDRNKVGSRSFYDKKKIEAGDFLKEAIAPAVRNGLAFIQLVHLDTFTSKQKVNWPFEEYKLFNEYNDDFLKHHEDYRILFESRLIPVIAGDPVKLKLPNEKLSHADHKPWRDRLFDETLYLRLPVNKLQFDNVMQKLEAAIVRRAYRIIESVPS